MLEYVFFHREPFEAFVAYLSDKGLQPQTGGDGDSFEVQLPEDIDDALSEEIEVRYDALMDLNRELFDSEQGQSAENYQAAGILVNLKDGQAVYADVDPALLARVMGVISAEEFGQIVSAIVRAVEEPDSRTFCQRMRDGDL